MAEILHLHRALVGRIREGDGHAPAALRRAAFEGTDLDEPLRKLLEKVRYHAFEVTDTDVDSVRAAGLSEEQIFEVVICAAVGQATRQYERAVAALAAVSDED